MILLDTNVLSEVMKISPDVKVVRWLDRHAIDGFWISAITAYEVRFGLRLLPTGRRRDALEAAYARLCEEILDGRIVAVDAAVADCAGVLSAQRRAAGITVDVRDTLIAATALVHGATVLTRNTIDFADIVDRVQVRDPWSVRV